MNRQASWKKTGFKTWLLASGIGFSLVSAQASDQISMVWKASPNPRTLKSWSISEIQALKSSSTREKDPVTGQVTSWKGPLMSLVIEKTIDSLPGDQKAQVDLLIFKSSTGDQAQVPRWLITKYPVLLGAQKDKVQLVLPWSSKPKVWEEGLPLNRYYLKDIVQVELANYHQVYGTFYLKRRTDPLALRGEKIFVQNCTSCHSVGIEKTARKIASAGHPQTKDAPQLKDRDMRALFSYLDAFRNENPGLGANLTSN